jgi:2'-5' RNA ligase
VRLFVALELPAEVRSRLGERMTALRDELPSARWVSAELLHLTLVFLGEVEEGLLEPIDRALGPVFAASPALRLRLGDPGTFPPRRPARVAWVAIETDGDLAALERGARRALDPVLAAPLADRPYHAHVTLARPRRPWSRGAIATFHQGLGGVAGEWEVRRAVLFESRLGAPGPRYAPRGEYALVGSEA